MKVVRLRTVTTSALARSRAAWPGLGLQAGVVLLGACATFNPSESKTSRVYPDVTSEALYDRTLQALRASHLEITTADPASGAITATAQFDRRNWATCPDSLMLVKDQSDDMNIVAAAEDHREVELTAAVTPGPEGGATLTVDPAFVTEPVSAMATTEECASTGVLERQIYQTVAAQA